MQRSIPIPETVLINLLGHAASAARLVGSIDEGGSPTVGRLADAIDAIVHELSELLGTPHSVAVPSAHPTFEHDAVTRNRLDDAGGVP